MQVEYGRRLSPIVDLRAVRPARLADTVVAEDLTVRVREFRQFLRGARCEPLADGVRLVLRLDVSAIARLADLVRAEADTMPYWSFRVLADPPVCWLEATGEGHAGDLARVVFEGLAA